MDETWLYHYDPEIKQQSMECRHSGSPHPKKFRVQKSAGKFFASIFWHQDSILPLITLFNTQNIMETRLTKLYYFEAAEFENDTEIFSLALVFELQLWPEISLFSTIY